MVRRLLEKSFTRQFFEVAGICVSSEKVNYFLVWFNQRETFVAINVDDSSGYLGPRFNLRNVIREKIPLPNFQSKIFCWIECTKNRGERNFAVLVKNVSF